ncbi:MAG: hypothetical protein ACJ71U_16270 [Terriglobales bacterium]
MKYLITFMAMLLLAVLALAARQDTTTVKPDDSEKGRPATGQASLRTTIDKAATSEKSNASEQNAQSEVKATNHGKLSLDLGSMPCPLDDQECRAKEKKRLEAPDEHP